MSRTFDAIVVGGGHNGLVSAAYLARAGARTLVLEGRHKTGGAATTETPVAGGTRVQGDAALLRDEPAARRRSSRTSTSSATGTRCTRWAPTTRRSPRAAPSRSSPTTAKRELRGDREVVEAGRRCHAAVGRLAQRARRRARAAAADGAAEDRLPPSRPISLDTLRLAWRNRGMNVRTIGDVTRLMTMSIADLLDDWFESSQVKSRHGRERRHRNLGRALRTGHRLCHGAPLHR